MKVLITRPRAQAADFADSLRAAGLEPIFFPVIEIQPIKNNPSLNEALKNLDKYAWVVFTSVNAVDVVLPSPPAPLPKLGEGSRRRGEGVRVAAVGPKTADALRKHNVEPDFIPEEYVGGAIMAGLGDVKDKWILLPRAEIASQDLPSAIANAGGIAHEITVYRTLPTVMDMDGLNALKSGVNIITFTSASTVENFIAIAQKNHLDPQRLPNNPLFACIGPVTAKAACAAGLENIVVAREYTTEGLVEIVKESTQVHT